MAQFAGAYAPPAEGLSCNNAPKRCRLAQSYLLRLLVAKKLALDWSPQQISGWLRQTLPNDPGLHVSHETIYRSLGRVVVVGREQAGTAGGKRV